MSDRPSTSAVTTSTGATDDVARLADLILDRALGERDSQPREFRALPAALATLARSPGGDIGFTLHLTFAAIDVVDARVLAAGYVTALRHLCPEVAAEASRLSYAPYWYVTERLFCAAEGPDGARCGEPRGHTGPHREAGPEAASWAADEAEPATGSGPVAAG